MKSRDAAEDREERNYASYVIVALLLAVVAAIGIGVMMQRDPDYALVLATPQDCLRAFDDAKCRAIVAQAMEVHAATAPHATDLATCEMQYGSGNCLSARASGAAVYVPAIAAIVLTRVNGGKERQMVPFYFDSRDSSDEQGRRVLFHGRIVGILRGKRFGGTGISMMTDLTGKPITSEAIRNLID